MNENLNNLKSMVTDGDVWGAAHVLTHGVCLLEAEISAHMTETVYEPLQHFLLDLKTGS